MASDHQSMAEAELLLENLCLGAMSSQGISIRILNELKINQIGLVLWNDGQNNRWTQTWRHGGL